MANTSYLIHSVPVAPLKIIALPGCEKMAETVDKFIVQFRSEIAEQAPHKVGDIIKWTEKGHKKNVGTTWNPKFVDVSDRERKAAVNRVIPCIYFQNGQLMSFKYDYEFVALKKDGTASKNSVYVFSTYEWTDEHINI